MEHSFITLYKVVIVLFLKAFISTAANFVAILCTVYNILQSIRLSKFNQISIVMLAKVFYVLEFKVKCQTKLRQLFSVRSDSLDFSVYLMQTKCVKQIDLMVYFHMKVESHFASLIIPFSFGKPYWLNTIEIFIMMTATEWYMWIKKYVAINVYCDSIGCFGFIHNVLLSIFQTSFVKWPSISKWSNSELCKTQSGWAC